MQDKGPNAGEIHDSYLKHKLLYWDMENNTLKTLYLDYFI
jgi:hypothetical protein